MENSKNLSILSNVTHKIAPTWPLKNMVAVNPFLGFTNKDFTETTAVFENEFDIPLLMPLSYYFEQFEAGTLKLKDIQEIYSERGIFLSETDCKVLLKPSGYKKPPHNNAENKSLEEHFIQGIGDFCSFYFDGMLNHHSENHLFTTWLSYAKIDLTPAILGYGAFKKTIQTLPKNHLEAFQEISQRWLYNKVDMENHLLGLGLKVNGWSAYIRGLDWDQHVYDKNSNLLDQFLVVLMCWEYAALSDKQARQTLLKTHRAVRDEQEIEIRAVMQKALDRSAQCTLIEKFNNPSNGVTRKDNVTKVKAVFCIDVRSEIFRRNLETVDSGTETIGFAGFFGVPISFQPSNSEGTNNQCPVLLPAKYTVQEKSVNRNNERIQIQLQFKSLLQKFRKSPITSFGFVSPLGLFFLPKLISDSFGWQKQSGSKLQHEEKQNTIDLSAIAFEDQLNMGFSALKGMGLTHDFPPIVAFIGHGASTTNNPHAAGLKCGACGGHSGEMNARTLARILNNPIIRIGIEKRGLNIPKQTLFVAGLHDTTTDEVRIYDHKEIPVTHASLIQAFEENLEKASHAARIERSVRLGVFQEKTTKAIINRSIDWAQTRPEWGLAGCNAFVIAKRSMTKHIRLDGRSFLHDYDYHQDPDLSWLEAILTAPMIVTSWINLQYYASTVAPQKFGGGNKTLHNVTAGIGVIEGSSGDLRIGLPLQSVHNGKQFEYPPNRLNVVINAPTEAIEKLLEKHPTIKDLFDNEWLYLFQMNDNGNMQSRYVGNSNWESLTVYIPKNATSHIKQKTV